MATVASQQPGRAPGPVSSLTSSPAGRTAALALGSVGVVYGDIGTSPLYAFKEAVVTASGGHGAAAQPAAVLGILSLITWALVITVTVKYVLLLLRADNSGEGGTLALMALVQKSAGRQAYPVLVLGAMGAALFYGDALITPAISVLSAVEGVKLAMPVTNTDVLIATVGILIALFAAQSRGTHRVAAAFGPIMVVWFLALAVAGGLQIARAPQVLEALNPVHAASFLLASGWVGIATLGAVFLAATGAEALYADLGHFGRKPITIAWFGLVLPCLLINYFGQGALVLSDPAAIESPFYKLVPDHLLVPLIALATVATIIASQATITGAYSISRQAIQLGLLPRLTVRHTSREHAGQIYMPHVNWIVLAGVLVLVLGFRSSERLASAYGIAVTGTMIITAILASTMMLKRWRWSPVAVAALMLPLIAIDFVFLSANLTKLADGGWITLLVAGAMLAIMLVWWHGSRIVQKKARRSEVDLDDILDKLGGIASVPGTAVYLTAHANRVPTALLHTMKHFKVLHERIVILSVLTAEWPYLAMAEAVSVETLSPRVTRVTVVSGFMQQPNIANVMTYVRAHGLDVDPATTSFFLARRSLKRASPSAMPVPASALYIGLASNAADATDYFRIPKDRVIEIGTQVEL